jgi:hypothetical protein
MLISRNKVLTLEEITNGKVNFVPFEISETRLAEINNCSIIVLEDNVKGFNPERFHVKSDNGKTSDLEDDERSYYNGIILLRKSIEGEVIYLVSSAVQKRFLNISEVPNFDFDRYINHNSEQDHSILFKDRVYPYELADIDYESLAERMGVTFESLKQRIEKKFKSDQISSRIDEINIVYVYSVEDPLYFSKTEEKRLIVKDDDHLERLSHEVAFLKSLVDQPLTEFDYRRLEQLIPEIPQGCTHQVRPCPVYSCPLNLCIDHQEKGNFLVINHPDTPFEEIRYSCCKDLGDDNPFAKIGRTFNFTLEAARQLETKALKKLRTRLERGGMNANNLLS